MICLRVIPTVRMSVWVSAWCPAAYWCCPEQTEIPEICGYGAKYGDLLEIAYSTSLEDGTLLDSSGITYVPPSQEEEEMGGQVLVPGGCAGALPCVPPSL